ncbi:MFS transporter [Salinigranum rubrum]|uniref:MFS transporter n=1 Tax=Salinigranum rubrum TaxID=755307 RepID=A0A2I8VGE4_9EURY|nr:MFS transporter [Salinigranum rubrum]AUV80981.1 MFS transporter [Salinigranum rubrum]
MKARTRWTVVVFSFVACHGVVSQTRGPLLASFEQSFEVSQGLLGAVAPAATVGLLLSVLFLGTNAGRVGVRRTLLAGVGLTVLSLASLTLVQSYWVLVGSFLLQGLGVGAVRALDRPLLGHLYPAVRGRMFNLYALTWAVGATIGPLFVNWVLAATDWRMTFLFLLLPLLPVVVLLWRASPPEEMHHEQRISLGDVRSLLARPAVLGMAAALVLSGSIEGTMFAWFAYYAGEFVPRARANVLLSGFLVMYVPGRLLYSYLCDRLPPLTLVLGLSLVGVPVTALAFTARSGLVLAAGALALGFVVAGFFPTLSAFGIDNASEYSGPVNAIATGANFLGITAAPLVVGVVAEQADIVTGMRLLVPAMAGLVVVVVLTRWRLARPA